MFFTIYFGAPPPWPLILQPCHTNRVVLFLPSDRHGKNSTKSCIYLKLCICCIATYFEGKWLIHKNLQKDDLEDRWAPQPSILCLSQLNRHLWKFLTKEDAKMIKLRIVLNFLITGFIVCLAVILITLPKKNWLIFQIT